MISCRRARSLLVEHARGAVGEVGLLRLDQHLVGCTPCRAERARWETVTSLRGWEAPGLSGAARARIVERLAAAKRVPLPPRRTVPPPLFLLLGATAVVALVAGAVSWRTRAPAAPAAAERHAWPSAGVLRFAGAELGYGAGTRVELRAATRTIALESGELRIATAAPLRITTAQYRVELVTGHAVFAADAVRVLDGQVVVYAGDERQLAQLGPGQSWPPAAAAATPVAAMPAVATPAIALAAPTVAAPSTAAPAVAARDALSATAALEHARSALAGGDVASARRFIARAHVAARSERERAEADLFLAESHLVERQPAAAQAAYRHVAEAYPRLPEGEAAAFALAQVVAENGSAADSARAFRAYLSRYPQGRFAREASDHLAPAPEQ